MTQVALAGWTISIEEQSNKVTIKVTHADNSPVLDTEADLGCQGDLCYRLTTEQLEAAYKANGDAKGAECSESVELTNHKIEFINDTDNHLSIYCTAKVTPEHISLTNGTQSSKSCDIELF
jgi:hypothetical protein